jgi:hypothetical protein
MTTRKFGAALLVALGLAAGAGEIMAQAPAQPAFPLPAVPAGGVAPQPAGAFAPGASGGRPRAQAGQRRHRRRRGRGNPGRPRALLTAPAATAVA